MDTLNNNEFYINMAKVCIEKHSFKGSTINY